MAFCYLTDLDGTLLRSDQSLSDYAAAQLTEALEAGTIISYATARSFTSADRVTSSIPWRYPVVLYNGAVLFDPVGKQVIGGNWLSPQLANDLLEAGRQHALTPLVFALDQEDREKVLHEKLRRTGEIAFYNSRPNDPRFQEVQALRIDESHRPLILTYIGLGEELEPLKRTIKQSFSGLIHLEFLKDPYIQDHYFLEMSHPLANKGEGAKLWAQTVGASLQELTVFGDNLNDLGMFRGAGTRIAVADAHEQLKQLADRIIGTCNEDAVARYIAAERTRLTT